VAVRVVDKIIARAPPSLLPKWMKPQLTCLVDGTPTGGGWVHEIKYDGCRMHAHIDCSLIFFVTRSLKLRRGRQNPKLGLSLAEPRAHELGYDPSWP
jgi:hypothetical protein